MYARFVRHAVGGWAAIGAAIAYSSFVLSVWLPTRVSARRAFISELEASGQPWSWVYRSCDAAAGLGMVVAALVVQAAARSRRGSLAAALLALAGMSSLVDGCTSMGCDTASAAPCAVAERRPVGMLAQLADPHVLSGLIGLIGVLGAAVLLGQEWGLSTRRVSQLSSALAIGIGSSSVADVVLLLLNSDVGIAERLRALMTSGWLVVLGCWLLFGARAARGAGGGGQGRQLCPSNSAVPPVSTITRA